MTRLVLGPLLRHVDDRAATVWVETEQPCEVRVLDSTAHTFTVHGHHYALVEIDGLEPGSDTPYEVALDGEKVWPEPESNFPPSRIRTIDPRDELRIAFGSCRRSPAAETAYGVDTLIAYAHRLADGGESVNWPSVLLMIGDQVYADELGDKMRKFITERRGDEAPEGELSDFEEYCHLYQLAWGEDEAVRWLLSTVPSLMIFDDHDIRDDWNTSHTWRQEMWSQPWWEKRIVGGLGTYWIYQHLGNLSAKDRAEDPLYAKLRAAGDGGELLDEFAECADKSPETTRWSYAHDYGDTRLIVVDSRSSRVLTPDRRAMLDDGELTWFEEQCAGDFDHLLIGSSLPYLLPASIHHAEAWNEGVAEGAWGRRAARLGEKIRQGADLEHWAAFERSFRTVAEDIIKVAGREQGSAPASIAFLSGDVHYSYLARVTAPSIGTPVSQVVCSPLRNPLERKFKFAQKLACNGVLTGMLRSLARSAKVPRPPLRWRITKGPWFDNAIATVKISGRVSMVIWETPDADTSLTELGRAELSA
ncbi:alkaline phosphatase D family protein [Actinomadura sp. HBU206391]|uniref:alkaline phosphatase D family protein n=1 Tax=Actinomadura sp. HBU206391 TaxID=2731692 RepID=UPI00164F2E1A|nr:alkaline phosphatase D family protein [Actinomadura sp. HBU206391]MBC6457613.1 alkaline phosphatase family protein [Actinomadura sp. HBU206391]